MQIESIDLITLISINSNIGIDIWINTPTANAKRLLGREVKPWNVMGQCAFLKFSQQEASYWCSGPAVRLSVASTLIPLAAKQSHFLLLLLCSWGSREAAISRLLSVSASTSRKPSWLRWRRRNSTARLG